MAEKKLDIGRVLTALDQKNYDFYDNLSPEEKKEFSPFILMRFSSTAVGDADLQEWFLLTTNEYVNKHHWTLSKNYKDLLWRLFSCVGVGVACKHKYLKAGSKAKPVKIEKLLSELYPSMKMNEIKMLASMMTKIEKDKLFDSMGFDKSQRKEYE